MNLFFWLGLSAQIVKIPQSWKSSKNPPLNLNANRIFSNGLDGFYKKLANLQATNTGVVRIVHIGDSHIQADMLTAEVRDGLQSAFGNAGRGLVFPYQLARSNAPDDFKASSNTTWQASRIAHKTLSEDCGIAGFTMQTNRPGASINILMKDQNDHPQTFKHLKIFTDTTSSWLLRTDSNAVQQISPNDLDSTYRIHNVLLDHLTNHFSLTTNGASMQSFYGASLENDEPGVIYNSIGVNGARYDQYDASPLFWAQLPALQADLYIISMGTNEAQGASFNEALFATSVQTFVDKIKAATPDATILITTAVDSYKGGRPNKVLQDLNNFLYKFTSSQHIPLWDQYRVTLGYSASKNWARLGLMQKDRVHFMRAGYELQGQLLLNALFTGYNNYVANH